ALRAGGRRRDPKMARADRQPAGFLRASRNNGLPWLSAPPAAPGPDLPAAPSGPGWGRSPERSARKSPGLAAGPGAPAAPRTLRGWTRPRATALPDLGPRSTPPGSRDSSGLLGATHTT